MSDKVKITMLADDRGAEDGITVTRYRAGESYEVTPALAEAFVEHRRTATYATTGEKVADTVKEVAEAVADKIGEVVDAATGQRKGGKKAGEAPAS